MTKEEAMNIVMKTMFLTEITGLDTDTIFKYFATKAALPYVTLAQLGEILRIGDQEIRELDDADRRLHVFVQ